MSIVNISNAFGLMGLIKGWSAGENFAARMDASGLSSARSTELSTRRPRVATPAVREPAERFEEDYERWDGLS